MVRVQSEERAQAQALPEPLSKRELEVLQLLARCASNQEIAQELVIAIDTVKRHVSHIFSKLGVNNRVQVIRQAQAIGLLDNDANLSEFSPSIVSPPASAPMSSIKAGRTSHWAGSVS